MNTIQALGYGLSILTFLLLVLAIYVRSLDRDNDKTKDAMVALTKWVQESDCTEIHAKNRATMLEFDARLDALESKYKTIRGTVARLHRSDVREPETNGAAPNDEAARLAYKESLRDKARSRGILK